MTTLTIQKRLLYYLLLATLSLVTPYLLTMILIIATGDRISGMKMGVFPGLLTVHIIFGLIFIKKNWLQKTLLTILLSALTFGFVWLAVTNELTIKTGIDIYGYWDLAITNFIAGLIIWETFFQIDSRLKKQRPAE